MFKKNLYSSYDPCSWYVPSSQSDCEIVEELPELYSHNYIPDAKPAPYGSSFTEDQEEEREDEEEEMAPAKAFNVQVRNSSQVDFSKQAIRTDSRHKMHTGKNSTHV